MYYYPERSQILPPFNPKSELPKLYYINGMETTLNQCIQDAKVLLHTFGPNANVIAAYSKAHGTLKDLASVWLGRNIVEYDSGFAKMFRKRLVEDIAELEKKKSPKKIFIVPFSRGGIDIYHAARTLNQKQRGRLVILSCGSAMILPRYLGNRVDNLVSKGDPACLYLHQELVVNPMAFDEYANVILLDRKDGYTGIHRDHFFASRTYQGALKDYRRLYCDID
ncbi:MAG: hypothetical protein JSS32_03080 [Verrucomicrobia bacterium]|nr:hypothetical protein [Verrucomicrobiota bacterium]